MTTRRAPAARDEAAVAEFVERFAGILTDAGIPRMPARVFVSLLATDAGRLTAAELAETLQASPAAVSGAVRYLTHLTMIRRAREPGTRYDYYYISDDAWYEAIAHREQEMHRWHTTLADGVAALDPGTPAGLRVRMSMAFVEFVQAEMPDMLKRWRERQARLREEWAAEG